MKKLVSIVFLGLCLTVLAISGTTYLGSAKQTPETKTLPAPVAPEPVVTEKKETPETTKPRKHYKKLKSNSEWPTSEGQHLEK